MPQPWRSLNRGSSDPAGVESAPTREIVPVAVEVGVRITRHPPHEARPTHGGGAPNASSRDPEGYDVQVVVDGVEQPRTGDGPFRSRRPGPTIGSAAGAGCWA